MKTESEFVHQKEQPSSDWWSRPWEKGLLPQLFSLLVLTPFLLLAAILLLMNLSEGTIITVLTGYLTMSIILAIIIKNRDLFFMLILTVLFSALFMTLVNVLYKTR